MYTECRHIMPSGRKCHSPALSGKPFCYYHASLHRNWSTAGRPAKRLPVFQIEDAYGIQMALAQVLNGLESPLIDDRRAGLALYGLQLAMQLVDRAKTPEPAETVRTPCNASGEPVDPSSCEDDAEVLAPEITHCEPPHDCINCRHQETCENHEDPDDDPQFEPEEEEPTEESDDDDDSESDDEEEEEDATDADQDEDALIDAALRILQKDALSKRPQCLTRPATPKSPRRQPPPPTPTATASSS